MWRWGRGRAGRSWKSPEQAYDAGLAAGQRGDFAAALRALERAEDLFAARGDLDGRAGAARSAWRSANYHIAASTPAVALEAGQRAIDGWTAVVEESGNQVWRRELVRACADVSVMAVMADHYDEAVDLAARGVEIARTAKAKGFDMSRDMQTELGTALHNLAAAHNSRAVAHGPPSGDRSRSDLREALRAADEEIRLRQTLARSPQPDLANWELASGLSQRVASASWRASSRAPATTSARPETWRPGSAPPGGAWSVRRLLRSSISAGDDDHVSPAVRHRRLGSRRRGVAGVVGFL